jgi:hypothetical protein
MFSSRGAIASERTPMLTNAQRVAILQDARAIETTGVSLCPTSSLPTAREKTSPSSSRGVPYQSSSRKSS